MAKRLFDLIVTVLAAPAWVPVILLTSIAIFLTSGWPVFYVSVRRVYRSRSIKEFKFRTMVRNAHKLVNRDTVPITKQHFLNLPINCGLYTRLGRVIERLSFTEFPQLFHVLTGHMTLVGNRPLPENVISSLKTQYPFVEERFNARCGLTGPVQLVGRQMINDEQRLRLEIAYGEFCNNCYSPRIDLWLLWSTVMICLRLRPLYDFKTVHSILRQTIDSANHATQDGNYVPSSPPQN